MDPASQRLIMGAAGAASGEKIYVEEVFSTYLYTGNGSTQTITNGIDLSGKGGLVWIKSRSFAAGHALIDTVRGKFALPITTAAQSAQFAAGQDLTSFNSDGFSIGTDFQTEINSSSQSFASWTFRKAAKFFDVVTWSGDGSSSRAISHSLGSVPGCIVVKATNTTGQWETYHRALNGGTNPENCKIILNSTAEQVGPTTGAWAQTAPTSTVFYVNGNANTNDTGNNYVAYLFAHDAGGFGDSGNDNVISCGSYTGNGSASGPTVTLGWEPQWLLIKRTDSTGNWSLLDNLRGLSVDSGVRLLSNTSDAEAAANIIRPLSTGFSLYNISSDFNASGGTYIYIAIRRGPMKTPTDATKVFNSTVFVNGSATKPPVSAGFDQPDLAISTARSGIYGIGTQFRTRLTSNGKNILATASTASEYDYSLYTDGFSFLQGGIDAANAGSTFNQGSPGTVYNFFKRAPGFFDVVAYTGTGSARTVSHNLGVAPELMIVKRRDSSVSWLVYSSAIGATSALFLNSDSSASANPAFWNDTSPTSSVFTVGTGNGVNTSGGTYIAYLFATCPGVSKVGSYTGSGTTKQIDCGFTNGARFVLIKRTDSTGGYYVWDTARGIVSGNDNYLLLNSTAAEVTNTDYIDPLSSGFEISSTAPAAINANGGSYIFLAIA